MIFVINVNRHCQFVYFAKIYNFIWRVSSYDIMLISKFPKCDQYHIVHVDPLALAHASPDRAHALFFFVRIQHDHHPHVAQQFCDGTITLTIVSEYQLALWRLVDRPRRFDPSRHFILEALALL